MHLGGNLLYLWIFGDNVEDEFGSAPQSERGEFGADAALEAIGCAGAEFEHGGGATGVDGVQVGGL